MVTEISARRYTLDWLYQMKALHFLPKVDCRDGQKCGVLHELRKNYNSLHVVVSTEDR